MALSAAASALSMAPTTDAAPVVDDGTVPLLCATAIAVGVAIVVGGTAALPWACFLTMAAKDSAAGATGC
jgi:hypothetical protein